jgi:uncharacterized Zn-finger protein
MHQTYPQQSRKNPDLRVSRKNKNYMCLYRFRFQYIDVDTRDPSPHHLVHPPQSNFPAQTAGLKFFPSLLRSNPPPKTPIMEDEKSKSKKKGAAHRKSLSCEYCSRSFARLEHLQRHLRTR